METIQEDEFQADNDTHVAMPDVDSGTCESELAADFPDTDEHAKATAQASSDQKAAQNSEKGIFFRLAQVFAFLAKIITFVLFLPSSTVIVVPEFLHKRSKLIGSETTRSRRWSIVVVLLIAANYVIWNVAFFRLLPWDWFSVMDSEFWELGLFLYSSVMHVYMFVHMTALIVISVAYDFAEQDTNRPVSVRDAQSFVNKFVFRSSAWLLAVKLDATKVPENSRRWTFVSIPAYASLIPVAFALITVDWFRYPRFDLRCQKASHCEEDALTLQGLCCTSYD